MLDQANYTTLIKWSDQTSQVFTNQGLRGIYHGTIELLLTKKVVTDCMSNAKRGREKTQ